MSHIATVAVEIADLEALKQACKDLGVQFVENQKTYRWYGVSVGDTPLPIGMTKDQLGKCDHAIKVPGVNYEVGVVRKANGKYTLAYDFWGEYGAHDGQKLLRKFGEGCKKIVQAYSVARVSLLAKRKGYFVTRKNLPNGNIKLEVMVH